MGKQALIVNIYEIARRAPGNDALIGYATVCRMLFAQVRLAEADDMEQRLRDMQLKYAPSKKRKAAQQTSHVAESEMDVEEESATASPQDSANADTAKSHSSSHAEQNGHAVTGAKPKSKRRRGAKRERKSKRKDENVT